MRPADRHLWRDENLGRFLLNAFRRFERDLLRQLREAGFARVRIVHLRVMRQMDMDGTRISVLAERAGVTKQAMSQLIAECVKLAFVQMEFDASDRRARIVRFTSHGAALIERARTIIVEIEAEFARILGPRRNRSLHAGLVVLADAYHRGDPPALSRANGHRILPPPLAVTPRAKRRG